MICILGFWGGYAGGANENTESKETLGAALETGGSPGGRGSSSSRLITSGETGSAVTAAVSSAGAKSNPGMTSIRLESKGKISGGAFTGFDTVVCGSCSSSEKSIAVGE